MVYIQIILLLSQLELWNKEMVCKLKILPQNCCALELMVLSHSKAPKLVLPHKLYLSMLLIALKCIIWLTEPIWLSKDSHFWMLWQESRSCYKVFVLILLIHLRGSFMELIDPRGLKMPKNIKTRWISLLEPLKRILSE